MDLLENLFCIDLRRAVCSRIFWCTALAMVFVEILSAGMLLENLPFGVTDILDNLFAGTSSADVLIMLFPLFPYALTYAKDEQEHNVSFWIVRSDVKTYVISKLFAACVSALLAVAVSFLLFACILLMIGHPLCNMAAYAVDGQVDGYLRFLQNGNVALYLLFYTLDRGMSAAMMAGCAVWLSSVYPNPYFAAVGPMCLYHLMLKAFSGVRSDVLMPSTWIEMVYSSPTGGWTSFLCKFGVTFLVCGVYAWMSVWFVKRRWRHA